MSLVTTVHVMLVGLERTSTVKPACLVNIKTVLGRQNALIVRLENFLFASIQANAWTALQDHTRQTKKLDASHVHPTRTLWSRVTTSLTVHVMLVGLERTTTVKPACLVNIKAVLGRQNALIVHQTLSLQLAVSQIPPVNVTLDMQEKMELHARRVV